MYYGITETKLAMTTQDSSHTFFLAWQRQSAPLEVSHGRSLPQGLAHAFLSFAFLYIRYVIETKQNKTKKEIIINNNKKNDTI